LGDKRVLRRRKRGARKKTERYFAKASATTAKSGAATYSNPAKPARARARNPNWFACTNA
jgi:hypothetical protein